MDVRTASGTSTSTTTTKQVVSSSPLLPPIDAPQPVISQSEKSLSEPPSTVTPPLLLQTASAAAESVAPSPAPPASTAAPPHVPAPTAQLLPSEPNLETYPIPTHVPFFAPEKVNFPNPVFRSNVRTNIVAASQSTTTTSTTTNGTSNGRNIKDKTTLLYTLIDKLNSATSTSTNADTFRKLTRLFKEVPIRRRWDQGGIEETGSETWAGALGDAGNFVETVKATLPHLDNNTVALECIRQLAVTQTGLFRYYERKLDDQGKSLESQLMEKLLDIRCNDNPTVSMCDPLFIVRNSDGFRV